MVNLRHCIQYVLLGIERYYRWRHHLRPVGDILLVGRQHYRGSDMTFPDGTLLVNGDVIGVLHFYNARLLRIEATDARQAALVFGRLMRESLRRLAQLTRTDSLYLDLVAFQGLTWLAPRGRSVGFVTQPCPDRLNTRWRAAYYRLLVWAFAPAPETRVRTERPTVYWLTRTQLLQRNASPTKDNEKRVT